jgi:hypothetical protein
MRFFFKQSEHQVHLFIVFRLQKTALNLLVPFRRYSFRKNTLLIPYLRIREDGP